MPAPEINVRLSAVGVQDVVNAFKRVQQETRNTRDEATLAGKAMEQLGELMPVVTIGLAVTKMVELGKEALDSAFSIGKLAQETGASAGTLSVLAMAAKDVGVSQDELGTAMVRLARNQEQATQGNQKSLQAFKALGISLADIKAKNPADLFVEIAQKLQQMPDGATKTAAAMQLFGKSGAGLIPVLNEIGQNGAFEGLEDKAKRLGLYLSDEFIAEARQGKEALNDMRDVAEGLSLQFMAGFVPQMAKGMEDFSTAIAGDGVNAFKRFGDFAGNVLRGIVNLFLLVGQTAVASSKSLIDGLTGYAKTAWEVAKAYAHGDLMGAYNALKTGVSDVAAGQVAIWGSYAARVQSEYLANPEPAKMTKPTGLGTGGSGTGQSDKDKQKYIQAQAAFWDAVNNARLQSQKAADAQLEAEDKAAYEAGLESLDEYYNDRTSRINAAADDEKAILQKKLDDEEAAAAKLMDKSVDYVKNIVAEGPAAMEAATKGNAQALQMLAKVEQTKAQMDQADITRQTQLSQNETQREQARLQATQQLLSDRQKLYTLEGNTSAAQQVAIQKELADTEELLIRLGYAEDQRAEILARAAANANAKAQMGGLSQQGGNALTGLQTDISAIQNKAANGSISELDATAQIIDLEKQRLPNLQQIANAMDDVVFAAEAQLLPLQKGTPEYDAQLQVVENLQKTADQYRQSVDGIASSLHAATSFGVELQNVIGKQGLTDVVSFFDAFGTGQKSASQALSDLGKDFETMIVHMIDQMIVY